MSEAGSAEGAAPRKIDAPLLAPLPMLSGRQDRAPASPAPRVSRAHRRLARAASRARHGVPAPLPAALPLPVAGALK